LHRGSHLTKSKKHKVIHYQPSVECYGCYEIFNEYRGMILHLESGFCTSGTNVLDLNRWAAQCYQWSSYIDAEYRDDMLDNVEIRDEYGAVCPFFCPCCLREFSLLSGLFQHVSTDSCDETLGSHAMKKLRRWLQVGQVVISLMQQAYKVAESILKQSVWTFF
jgi:hypothetical protein